MSFEYQESDFMTRDEGIKYLFKSLSIIYGNKITNHWGDMDIRVVMKTWQDMIGNYLTYRPILDFALKNLDPNGFVTTPMAICELCKQAGRIPVKPEVTLTHQKTQEEMQRDAQAKEIALKQLKSFLGSFGKC